MRIRAIIFDTLRQTVAKGTLLAYLGLSLLTILVLSVAFGSTTVDGVTVYTFFGQEISTQGLVQFLTRVQTDLVSAGYAGMLILGVFATAGVLPDIMQRGTIDLYLSKPVGRPFILLGRYLGGLAAIVLNIAVAVFGLWIMFGLKTGIWNGAFLYSAVTLSFSYAVVFCYIMLLALVVRSSGFVITISFFYMFIVDGILAQRQAIHQMWHNDAVKVILDILYYALPQLTDLQLNTVRLVSGSSMSPFPFYYSAASGMAALILALILFNRKDF